MTQTTPASGRLAIRLSAEEHAALATISAKLASPLRRPPSTSDAIRAAIRHAAATLPATVSNTPGATRAG